MDMPKGFYNMICTDIERLDNAKLLSREDQFKLHREIDGRYQACVKQWYDGLWCSNPTATMIFYGHLTENPSCITENLDMMKAKLETYKYQMNTAQSLKPEISSSQVVNVTNSIAVTFTFEQARKKIEEMTSLTNEQTQEILDKVSEIEAVVNSNDRRKTKWEKVKPVLTWLADKSCDVGIALLPLLLKI